MKKYKEFLIKGILLGLGIFIGFMVPSIVAVEITEQMHSFKDGAILSAENLNQNFNALKTSIESIPDWKKNSGEATFDGTVRFKDFAGDWDHSAANGGYVDIGQLRIQWGRASVNIPSGEFEINVPISFPTAFANNLYSISVSPESQPAGSNVTLVLIKDKTTNSSKSLFVEHANFSPISANSTLNVNWIAFGLKP